ncbi:hypothetical protein BABINDRAFT_35300 [Babjeviella inositovora NRRL Y-12698]|uniref:Elongation factor 1-gamma 1 n=1 Tax=Babjeviella inositovora NRRL Y-12698 TaxID=984486 RepID=A0A1E3QS00_9ASCO|nr:uncharacterized protein BABINDRAFT_35300 [Babjeviella inositovora NRRL Y-12698]ODQ80274.1 hypothetical protein BABINDRAFT_35300 [Babjeviella inositovora NRRL Y-12698]
MSQGTLYLFPTSPRSTICKNIADYFKLDIKIGSVEDAEFKRDFPLGKTPAFKGDKGFKLHECISISLYFLSLVDNHGLLGKNNREYAQVLKYLSFSNQEVAGAALKAIMPTIGKVPYNKKSVDEGLATLEQLATIFETRLYDYTYLVGERLSLADLFAAGAWGFALSTVLGKDFQKKHPYLVRWFKTVTATPILKAQFAEFKLIEKPLEFTPVKKEKKAAAPSEKKAEKKAEKEVEEPADETYEEPKKAKHPLEALGKSKLPLDEWKRVYSNEDTREKAIPWFWEHYDPSEWSLWKVGYKYNDELTLCFMSNNLVGGFFNRLSGSTKYLFGSMVVYGENNDNGIVGAFLVRGQDSVPAFDVAPDWESYYYEKLDGSSEADKEFINNMFAWDKPVVVDGVSREISDGKVFK